MDQEREQNTPMTATSVIAEPAGHEESELAINRRELLGGIGGAAVSASMAGGLTVAALSAVGPGVAEADAAQIGPDSPQHRRNNAFKIRKDAAQEEKQLGAHFHKCNGDEAKYPSYIGQYHKCLPHDPLTGEVDPIAYQDFLKAIADGDFAAFEALPGQGRFLSPLGALGYNMEGPDSAAVPVAPPPSVDSAELAADAAERYWMALLRDKPFATWSTDPDVLAACASLTNNYTGYLGPRDTSGNVTPANVFRADIAGVLDGPLISQYLVRNFFYDGISVTPRLTTAQTGQDFMTEWNEWVTVQNGAGAGFFPPLDATARFPRSMRDLGMICALDRVYSVYFRAILILQAIFPFAASPGLDANHPYQTAVRQGGFSTFGLAHVTELVGSVGKGERPTWYSKWNVNRFLRPEAYGGLVHRVVNDGASYPVHSDLLNDTDLLDRVFNYNLARNTARGLGAVGTYLLPQMFRVGSPNHPSFPAGHGFTAGACVTVLKAFYNEAQPFPGALKVAADGLTTSPYVVGVDGPQLTIGGELNKLAYNLSLGRDMSGVHWRTDSIGAMLQGEEFAIRWLAEQGPTFREPFNGWNLTKFDGTSIVV